MTLEELKRAIKDTSHPIVTISAIFLVPKEDSPKGNGKTLYMLKREIRCIVKSNTNDKDSLNNDIDEWCDDTDCWIKDNYPNLLKEEGISYDIV